MNLACPTKSSDAVLHRAKLRWHSLRFISAYITPHPKIVKVTFALAALLSIPSAASAAESAWLLDVKSLIAGAEGTQSLVICEKGLDISSKGFDIQITGETVRLLMIYHARKEYCEMKFDDFAKRYAIGDTYVSTSESTLKQQVLKRTVIKGKTGTICGLPVSQYLITFDNHGKKAVWKEFWATTAVKAPARFVDAWAKITGVPTGYGMPLKLIHYTYRGPRKELDTMKVACSKLPPDAFKPVKGYKAVKSEVTMLMHMQSGDSLEELYLPK